MTLLPAEQYAMVEQSMPIVCVDFVTFRVEGDVTEVGLILRDSPFGRVWCHLGGRILRGETIADALRRHAHQTLAVDLELADDAQPTYVYQWFPPDMAPNTPGFGIDPRKHAIGLSFVTHFVGRPRPRNEALDFAYFPIDRLPAPMWPGAQFLVERLAQSIS